MHSAKTSSFNLISNCMTVNVNMLCALMEYRIHDNVESRLVITEKLSSRRRSDMKIPKELLQPNQLASGQSKTPILCFCTASAHHRLLLRLPGDQRSTQEDTKTTDRTPCILTSSPDLRNLQTGFGGRTTPGGGV